MSAVRVRFAPSPTGKFHVGLARTALFNFLFARHEGGEFLLRIEDTDAGRSRIEFENEIMDVLTWLGIQWDETPLRQSDRLEIYKKEAFDLVETGKAYRCFCRHDISEKARKAIQEQGGQLGCSGACPGLDPSEISHRVSRGDPFVLRLLTPPGVTTFRDMVFGEITVDNSEMGDFVLLRSDGTPVYHLAVVIDDESMGVTHVIRGVDHLKNTAKHIQLYAALGGNAPVYAHLPMILGPDKQKLSKRHSLVPEGDRRRVLHLVEEYRDAGYLSDALVNFLALLGWSPGSGEELLSRNELVKEFMIERASKKDAIFDPEKLTWMNGYYIRSLSPERFSECCLPFLERADLISLANSAEVEYARCVLPLIQERAKTLADAAELTEYFFLKAPVMEEKAVRKHLTRPGAADKLRRLKSVWESLPAFTLEATEESLRGMAEEMGLSPGKLIHPTRVAMTGRMKGPGLFELAAALGRERVLERLEWATAIAQ